MDRAQEIGLFRWQIVGEATDVSLSARERGRLVRALAEREHLAPDGRWVRVGRNTLDRWIRAYREGGFDGLVPAPRRVANATPERLLELAVALRREQPARTAAQIHRILVEAEDAAPSARTIQRHLAAAGLPWKGSQIARALGRFEAESRNELWTGDALHGPLIDGRRVFLFCFIDDHSRLLVGYRWAAREDVLNASRALRAGIAARGLPKAVYVDNGSPFVSGQLLRACAVLGIRLIHSTPGRPEGRGKIERVFRTVREQLLVELEDRPPASLEDLSRIFQSWVEQVYHRRVHSETGQTPLERFLALGPPPLPERARADRSVPLVRAPDGIQDGHRWDARQHLRGRPRARRPPGRSRVRPARAGRCRCPDRWPARWAGGRAEDQTSRPSTRPAANAADRADRDRLPRPGPEAPRPGASAADRLPALAGPRRRRPRRQQGDDGMSIDRLRAHWGLSRTPFTKELATSMLFASAAHQEAVARVGWIISERALGVVCGEVGAGKTVAARAASRELDSSRYSIIYLPNPAVGARGIYTQIVTALGATPRFYRATLIPQATDLIAAETAERGKTVVLILDEAHLLSAEQLEELRMLTNAEMDSRATFACLLLGQPTLRRKLRQGVFAALDQRIALRCTIDGMDRKETGDYIAHHVKLAGRSDTLFSDDAVALIHDASRGLPRAVNNLATQTLIAAYAQNKSICDESSARAALAEITAE